MPAPFYARHLEAKSWAKIVAEFHLFLVSLNPFWGRHYAPDADVAVGLVFSELAFAVLDVAKSFRGHIAHREE